MFGLSRQPQSAMVNLLQYFTSAGKICLSRAAIDRGLVNRRSLDERQKSAIQVDLAIATLVVLRRYDFIEFAL